MNGIVQCADTTPHGLTNDDQIMISEVKGMTEVNGGPYEIKII